MKKSNIINSCRLCSDKSLNKVLKLTSTPIGDLYLKLDQSPEKLPSYPLDVMQCSSCGHVQLEVMVSPEEIYKNYIYTTSISVGLKNHFEEYASSVRNKLSLREGDKIIEMGSNDGTLLGFFKGKGMQVLGVDPAKKIAEVANGNGIETINDFFTPNTAEKISAKYGKADLFIANNVLANVPSIHEIIKGIKLVLKQDGIFVFETGYLSYLAEGCVFDNIHHEHIDYFAVAPLVKFFKSKEMEVIDVEFSMSKGGSIRCYVQNKEGKRAVQESVRKLVKNEIEQGYFKAETYQKLERSLEEIKEKLKVFFDRVEKEGKIVAGFGASIGVTTMLYHFDLGRKIQYLVDDNPVRHGLRSPGFGIEVIDPSILLSKDRPDYLIIFAWRYEKIIIEKHKIYEKNGGVFLKIMPNFDEIF